MNSPTQKRGEQGFALVVIAAIFISFALVSAAFLDRSTATTQLNQGDQTRAQLQRISSALLQYYIFNNGLYPCPADATLLPNDPAYGKSFANCDVNLPSDNGIVVLSNAVPTTEVIRGMVPINALIPYGLVQTDAIDIWNNRVMYVVNRKDTVAGGIPTVLPNVMENVTGETFHQPDFIVMSYGRDGLGAIPRNSIGSPLPCPAASSTLRQRNCDMDLNFVQAPPLQGASIGNNYYFDDYLSFYSTPMPFCPSQTLNWGSCAAVAPISRNLTSITLTNTTATYDGTTTATCVGTSWQLSNSSCTATAPAHCSAQVLAWDNCKASFPSVSNGTSSPSVNNDPSLAPGYSGSAAAYCNSSGVWATPSGTCTNCAGQTYHCNGTSYETYDGCGNLVSSVPGSPACASAGVCGHSANSCDSGAIADQYSRTCNFGYPGGWKDSVWTCDGTPCEGGKSTTCFLAETRITLTDGTTKPIGELVVGDKVRGHTRVNRVLSLPVVTNNQAIYGFNGGKKFVTAGHPFLTTKGWKAIDPSLTSTERHNVKTTKLEMGDRLLTDTGKKLVVHSIEREESGDHDLFNPIMDGDHTYYANGLLVHNKHAIPAIPSDGTLPSDYPPNGGDNPCVYYSETGGSL